MIIKNCSRRARRTDDLRLQITLHRCVKFCPISRPGVKVWSNLISRGHKKRISQRFTSLSHGLAVYFTSPSSSSSAWQHYHPIVAVMAAHTEILTGLESQLDATERRLATNGEQIRKLGPAGDRQGKSWRELFGKLLGTKWEDTSKQINPLLWTAPKQNGFVAHLLNRT